MLETNDRKRYLTKRPMIPISSVRMSAKMLALLREAAAIEGISQSEFLRRATCTEAARILRRQKRAQEAVHPE